jgi:uncharacterized protein YjbI with pentapeptide repeats
MRWPSWLGVGERRWKKSADEEVQPAKTAWDWLQLLIVPGMLVVIALAFNASQASRDRAREDRRIREDRALAAAARQDDTLDSYLSSMRELILERHLLRPAAGSEVGDVARTATLSTVRRLDGQRKGEVVKFLIEARLIAPRGPIDIADADLRGADLRGLLGEAFILADTDLRGARFDGSGLDVADFHDADLRGASFKGASIAGVRFDFANLTGAVFDGAAIGEGKSLRSSGPRRPTSFDSACIDDTSFVGTSFTQVRTHDQPAHFHYATGDDVNFTNAHGLDHIDVTNANLTNVQLTGADERLKGWQPHKQDCNTG